MWVLIFLIGGLILRFTNSGFTGQHTLGDILVGIAILLIVLTIFALKLATKALAFTLKDFDKKDGRR